MDNDAKKLADEYRRLGGTRLAAVDDNLSSTRRWESEPSEAESFWEQNIRPLDDKERRDVESFLPSVNAH